MSVQLRNSEMVDLLSADFVRKTDSFWLYGPQVKKSVSLGDKLVIFPGYQYIVYGRLDVYGTTDIYGDLVII